MSYITTVTVKEITMAAPDIICLRVRDQEIVPGYILDHGAPDVAGRTGAIIQRVDPRDSISKDCHVIGNNADHYRFLDVEPTAFLDRVAAANPANYPTIGTRTVTNVYIMAMPYDEGTCSVAGVRNLIATMEYHIFLKLSANLPQGGPYTVSVSGNTFPSTAFTFNDKTTRAVFLHSTQAGHRAGEKHKVAYLAGWIPGFGTEGRIDIPTTYGLTTFDILDSAGGLLISGLPITLALAPTSADSIFGANIDYVSNTQAKLTASSVTPGVTTQFVTTGVHGLTTGNKVYLKGFAGMNIDDQFYAVTVINTTTFTIPVNTTGQTWASGSFAVGYDGIIFKSYSANGAGTYVYKCDYSNVTILPNTYRLRIAGLGVSDQFTVDENAHVPAIQIYQKGYYNQSSGFALTGYAGVTRPADYKDGVNGVNIFESLAPAALVDETGFFSPALASGTSAAAPWKTATRATGFGGSIRDAGDWDYHCIRHCPMSHNLLEFAYRRLPAASKGQKFGFPNASAFIGAFYSGIDALDDTIHMALMQLDTFRATQKVDGRVYSGLQFSLEGSFTITGGGGSNIEPSYLSGQNAVALAADPASNIHYALAAAKLAQVFTELGQTALATAWTTSAKNAFDWAETLNQDYLTNGPTGTAVQAYFNTTLGIKAKMGWTDPQVATFLAAVFSGLADYRLATAAILYTLTGVASYGNLLLAPWNAESINDGSETGATAVYEIGNSTRFLTDFSASITAGALSYYQGRIAALGLNNFPHFSDVSGFDYQILGMSPMNNGFLQRALAQTQASDQTLAIVKALHAQQNWVHGGNQQGMTAITGFGQRYPNCSLIRDREAMGLKGYEFLGTAVFFMNYPYGLNFVFNNFGGDNQSDYTAEIYTGSFETYHGSKKLIAPQSHMMWPKHQSYFDASGLIFMAEFATQNTIAPSYAMARLRHALGGNNQLTKSVQRIRRSVTTAP